MQVKESSRFFDVLAEQWPRKYLCVYNLYRTTPPQVKDSVRQIVNYFVVVIINEF